jgi:hypothetical protein
MAPVYGVGGCELWGASPTKGEINQSVKHYIGDFNMSGLIGTLAFNSGKGISQVNGVGKKGLASIRSLSRGESLLSGILFFVFTSGNQEKLKRLDRPGNHNYLIGEINVGTHAEF